MIAVIDIVLKYNYDTQYGSALGDNYRLIDRQIDRQTGRRVHRHRAYKALHTDILGGRLYSVYKVYGLPMVFEFIHDGPIGLCDKLIVVNDLDAYYVSLNLHFISVFGQ